MYLNLLTNAPAQTREVGIGEAALYATLGYAVVFIGIAFLIFVVWAIGKAMTKTQSAPQKAPAKANKETPTKAAVKESLAVADATQEEISEETVAVIMAALMAYYEKTNRKCEFTVKRIKKI